MVLVRRLVLREPHVAVRPEELRRAELRLELCEQRLHRRLHALVVDVLVVAPVRLRVVRAQAFVEDECLLREAGEAHADTSAWSRTCRSTRGPVSRPRAVPSGSQ